MQKPPTRGGSSCRPQDLILGIHLSSGAEGAASGKEGITCARTQGFRTTSAVCTRNLSDHHV